MAEFRDVCPADELQAGKGLTVEVAGKLIALFGHDGKYFALEDACPHMGASLSKGCLENGIVTCPWHGWRFRLADGAWADNPRMKTGCYHVRVQDGMIQVKIEPPTSLETGN